MYIIKIKSKKRIIFAFAAALALCIGTAGCVRQKDTSIQNMDIFWPNPPEVKRIQFIGAVSRPEDLNIQAGVFKKVFNYIVGKSAAAIVSPYGIAADAIGRLYVVDTFLKKVHVFDPEANTYFSFPNESTSFVSPVGIAIDESGLIYVTDSKEGVVKIFTDEGKKFVSDFGRGVFKRPTGIAVNQKTSELLVLDTVLAEVFRYDLDNRMLKGKFGGNGAGDGRFHFPTNIFVTSAGNIIVSDSLNFRIQVFSPVGRFINDFGSMGDSPGTFSRPKGVAADSDGNIYAVDALFDNIQIFDKEGRLLMAFGNHGRGYGEFWLPTGIYIDPNDFIYVSDSSNKRVQVFKYLKEDVVK